jgi:hypothetical protein
MNGDNQDDVVLVTIDHAICSLKDLSITLTIVFR